MKPDPESSHTSFLCLLQIFSGRGYSGETDFRSVSMSDFDLKQKQIYEWEKKKSFKKQPHGHHTWKRSLVLTNQVQVLSTPKTSRFNFSSNHSTVEVLNLTADHWRISRFVLESLTFFHATLTWSRPRVFSTEEVGGADSGSLAFKGKGRTLFKGSSCGKHVINIWSRHQGRIFICSEWT